MWISHNRFSSKSDPFWDPYTQDGHNFRHSTLLASCISLDRFLSMQPQKQKQFHDSLILQNQIKLLLAKFFCKASKKAAPPSLWAFSHFNKSEVSVKLPKTKWKKCLTFRKWTEKCKNKTHNMSRWLLDKKKNKNWSFWKAWALKEKFFNYVCASSYYTSELSNIKTKPDCKLRQNNFLF